MMDEVDKAGESSGRADGDFPEGAERLDEGRKKTGKVLAAIALIAAIAIGVGIAVPEISALSGPQEPAGGSAPNGDAYRDAQIAAYDNAADFPISEIDTGYLKLDLGEGWRKTSEVGGVLTAVNCKGVALNVTTLNYGGDVVHAASSSGAVVNKAQKWGKNQSKVGSIRVNGDSVASSFNASSASTCGTAATITATISGEESSSDARAIVELIFNGDEGYIVYATCSRSMLDDCERDIESVLGTLVVEKECDLSAATKVENGHMSAPMGTGATSGADSAGTGKSGTSSAGSSSKSGGEGGSGQTTEIQSPDGATDSRVAATAAKVELYCMRTHDACMSADATVQSYQFKDGDLFVHGEVEMRTRDGVGRYYGNYDAIYSGSSTAPTIKLKVQGR